MITRVRTSYMDEIDAFRQMIALSGKSEQELAIHLFPELKRSAAHVRLLDCLNPARQSVLSFGLVLRAMKFCGQIEPLLYMCDATGHRRPGEMENIGQDENLIQAVVDAAEQLRLATDALARHAEERAAYLMDVA